MIDAPVQSATCDNKTAQPLDATWNVMVGSTMRVARVHVPASYDPSKRTPVVVDIPIGARVVIVSWPKASASGRSAATNV